MNKHKNKSKAPKNQSRKQNGFFRALFTGTFTCALAWIMLSLIFSVVMSNMQDSNKLGAVFSMLIPAVSLILGGFAAGKTDKSCAVLASLLLGCAFLGIGYAVSSALSLSKGIGSVMKTFTIAIMLLSPLLGARFSTRDKGIKRPGRKRM